MNEQIYGYISSIVTGLVTNGIQGIFDYITKENLQDRITNVIETAQEIYEKEYQCSNSSLFIWQKNIEFYTQWLMEGFLPRKDVFPPVQYGEKADSIVTLEEVDFIYRHMDRLVKNDPELRSLHASIVCDDIYRMLEGKEKSECNQDYYGYVKSYGSVLFLHKAEDKRAITLKDTYVRPDYDIAPRSSMRLWESRPDIEKLLAEFPADRKNRVMVMEGDAGVGKSSLISHLAFGNEKAMQESENGIFDGCAMFCVRLRNLTMSKKFIEAPVKGILGELGFETYEVFAEKAGKSVLFLDGFDELCMIDGMTDFAEQILSEIIRGFSESHIIITTRPKFIDVLKLKEEGIGTGIAYVLLKHFNAGKREEWIEKYRKVCDREEFPRLDRILGIEDDSSDGICDTPLALYMLAAGKITDEAWDNPWVLYHQIFSVELSNTEYNKLFSRDSYTHMISRYKDVLYRVGAEIAYKMYATGNKKLYVTQDDIGEIISGLQLESKQTGQIVRRCYALCNYWKNDGKRGVAEFYHNNIRDFFLCEKIFYELETIYQSFDEECMRDEQKRSTVIEAFICAFSRLFADSDVSDKVSEFIYYRSLYKMLSNEEEEFIRQELKYQFLGYFFEKMFFHGAVHDYRYDGKRSLFQENINVLRCIVQIYRHIYEPYAVRGKKRLEWFFNAGSEMNDMEGLPFLFKPVFIRTPVTITSDYSIPVAGYANFNLFDMKKADLRYGMFNHSKFLSCDFSDTILASTDFSNAMLVNCNFENADFRFSSLAGANIKGSKFDNCILSGTTLPDGFCSNVNEEQMEHLKKLLQAADEGSASMDGGVKE